MSEIGLLLVQHPEIILNSGGMLIGILAMLMVGRELRDIRRSVQRLTDAVVRISGETTTRDRTSDSPCPEAPVIQVRH